ncbi:hypothetical protein V0288_23785 [Pannus brasiliensis CCIBt3594]|uniref:Uncharacterized protein n=1 Tax=Pannus brasiliensis CCIBt3594 TaxID=1427578 RepID=A0AAW9QZB5_9CHRO
MLENGKITAETILQQIESLSPEERARLLSLIKPGATIVFCGSPLISHAPAIQINSNNSGDLKTVLEAIPPEALSEIVQAIAQYILTHQA